METQKRKKKIVLWASGSGTNVENIIRYFKQHSEVEVAAVFTNNPHAGVLTRAAQHQVPTEVLSNTAFEQGSVNEHLDKYHPDLIVLAGFLRKVAPSTIAAYPNAIINIHPALLPDFGGPGMYGMRVHEAVLASQVAKSGITIHYVSDHYDEGAPIFQEKIALSNEDTPESLAAKIHQLEYLHFPKVIEDLLCS
jgi:phosphoribosylglycinamide formyltransferase-1